jgi:hypothetical protein
MFAATDSEWAPWYVARSEDKKRVRLNVIRHILDRVPYEKLKGDPVELPEREIGNYTPADYPFKLVEERY